MAGFGSGTVGKEKLGVAHLKHGGYSYLRGGPMPGCDRCILGQKNLCEKYDRTRSDCTVGLEAMDELVSKIFKLPWIRPEDGALVEEYARARIFLFLVDRWLMVVSPFRIGERGDLDARSILKMRWVVTNSMSRLANQLGLSPESRKNLGISLTEEADLEKFSAVEERFRSMKAPEIPAADGNGKEPNDSEREA